MIPERMARCTYFSRCKNQRPSRERDMLAFFEDWSEGSYWASTCDVCGMSMDCHSGPAPHPRACATYKPRGDRGHDGYYCGCFGWD